MPAEQRDYVKNEKIDGRIYDMSPAAHYRHGAIDGNIYSIVKNGLKGSMCLVYMENLDYKYNPETDDYLEPDIMICCDRNLIRGNSYYGTPKFIVETISPSTAKRDKTIKKEIYERAGVDEYWIISPIERAVDIFYLRDGKYELEEAYVVDDDENSEYYNLKQEITLRCFPITMTLEDIFTI